MVEMEEKGKKQVSQSVNFIKEKLLRNHTGQAVGPVKDRWKSEQKNETRLNSLGDCCRSSLCLGAVKETSILSVCC